MMYLTAIAFYGIPIAVVVFLIIALYRYVAGRMKNKREPGSFSEAEMRKRKILLVLAFIITGIFAVIVTVIAVMLVTAVAYM